MKKLLLIAALFCATAIVVQAEDAAAPAKKVKKELTVLQSAAKTKISSLILQHDLDLVEAEINSTQKIISQL